MDRSVALRNVTIDCRVRIFYSDPKIRPIRGSVVSTEEDEMIIERKTNDGIFDIPIPYSDIRQVEVY